MNYVNRVFKTEFNVLLLHLYDTKKASKMKKKGF
jgi:hypothetical protein